VKMTNAVQATYEPSSALREECPEGEPPCICASLAYFELGPGESVELAFPPCAAWVAVGEGTVKVHYSVSGIEGDTSFEVRG